MSLIATLALTLSMSLMLFVGGMIVVPNILACQGWQLIILLSLVSNYLCFLCLYLLMTLLATSVGVERTFSKGRLLLSHIRNCLSVQSTCALMCVGVWSLLGYVHDNDIKKVTALEELIGEERMDELSADWDAIWYLPTYHLPL